MLAAHAALYRDFYSFRSITQRFSQPAGKAYLEHLFWLVANYKFNRSLTENANMPMISG
jgi:hypothetical protein